MSTSDDLRTEARQLFVLAHDFADEDVVAQIHALAWELEHLAAGEENPLSTATNQPIAQGHRRTL